MQFAPTDAGDNGRAALTTSSTTYWWTPARRYPACWRLSCPVPATARQTAQSLATRGNTWTINATIGAITGYTSLWFTVKHSQDDADSDAILQIKLNSTGGSDDDLIYVNGATSSDSTPGAITVIDASTGAIIIAVDETVTDDMPAGAPFYYDVQVLNSGTVTTPDSGTTITADVTAALT